MKGKFKTAKRACLRLAGIVKDRAMVVANSLAFPPGSEIEVAWRQGPRITWFPQKARVVGWDWRTYKLIVRWPGEKNKISKLNPAQFKQNLSSKLKLRQGDFRFPKQFRRRYVGARERMAIAERQNYKCTLCDKKLGHHTSLDHVVPNACTGDNRSVNLQLVHNHCHKEKTARDRPITARRGRIRIH